MARSGESIDTMRARTARKRAGETFMVTTLKMGRRALAEAEWIFAARNTVLSYLCL